MIAFYFVLVIAYFCTYCLKKVHMRLSALLLWNGLIRLFIELYLETALLSMYNVHNLEWPSNSPLHIASNILAIIFLTLVGAIPIFLLYFFYQRK